MVIENFFSDAELEPVKKAISDLVETSAQKLYKGGKIKSVHVIIKSVYLGLVSMEGRL